MIIGVDSVLNHERHGRSFEGKYVRLATDASSAPTGGEPTAAPSCVAEMLYDQNFANNCHLSNEARLAQLVQSTVLITRGSQVRSLYWANLLHSYIVSDGRRAHQDLT